MLQFFMPKDPRFCVEETAWRISQNFFENLIPVKFAHSVNVFEISQNHDLGGNPLRMAEFFPSTKKVFEANLRLKVKVITSRSPKKAKIPPSLD